MCVATEVAGAKRRRCNAPAHAGTVGLSPAGAAVVLQPQRSVWTKPSADTDPTVGGRPAGNDLDLDLNKHRRTGDHDDHRDTKQPTTCYKPIYHERSTFRSSVEHPACSPGT